LAKQRVAIGFRVRTARATAVVVTGSPDSPQVLERRALVLSDPDVPWSGQPFHAGLELEGEEGERVVKRACQAARRVALREVKALARDYADAKLLGVGLVVGSDIDPAKLGNPHVRAHASEGKLFREVIEAGVDAIGAKHRTLVERELYAQAEDELVRSEGELKRLLIDLGSDLGAPWRAEEKGAALAAWLILAG
jgi:hypothetical protein